MAHAQKPDFVFRRNGRVHLNRRGRQFSLLLAAEVCASAVVMLDTPCSEVVCRVLVTRSIRQFPLHFPSRASPCAITFQQGSTDQWFPKCALRNPRDPRPVPRGSVDTFLQGYHAHPASCKIGTGSFPGVKCGRGGLLNTHPLLMPRSWKSSAITLPTLWATPGL